MLENICNTPPFAADRPLYNKNLILSLFSIFTYFQSFARLAHSQQSPDYLKCSATYGANRRSQDCLAAVATMPLGNGPLVIPNKQNIPFEYTQFLTRLIVPRR